MNIFDLLESPGMGRPRDTNGIQSAADQSAASVIGSGTTKREAKKKPVTMMGVGVKESFDIGGVKNWLLKLKQGLSTEAEETKAMFDTYVRYTQGQASEQEMNAANEQFKDLLRGLGMGTLAAMPGSVVTLPLVFKLAKKFNIELMPSAFKNDVQEGTPVNVNALMARGDHGGTGGPWWAKAGDLNYMGDTESNKTLQYKLYFPGMFGPRAMTMFNNDKDKLIKYARELHMERDDDGKWYYPVYRATQATKHEITRLKYTFGEKMIKKSADEVEEAAVKPNFKMPPESVQDKMYRQHQELRKQRGAPSAEEYKQRIAQKQKEIDDLKEGILDRAIPKMPKPRNPANAVLGNKVNASGRHLDKKRRQDLNPKHKHKDPMAESTGPLNWTVHFDDGTSQRVTIPSDEFDVRGYFAKRGKKVVKIDYSFAAQDRQDAPRRGTDDPAARADQERRAHIAHDRGLTEQAVKITDYDTWSDKVKALGGEIHPQKDRNVLVAQSWDGEEIGKFHLGKSMGFINQSGDLDETIRKMGSQYRLLSKKGKNLGTFDSKAGAEKHEREVQYFKHKNMEEDSVVEDRIRPNLVTALKELGFKGPFKLGQLPNWIDSFSDGAFDKETDIMISGDDPESAAWVAKGYDYGYSYGAEQGYQTGLSAKQVLIKAKQDQQGVDEDISRRGFLRGLGAAALAGAAAFSGDDADAQNIDLPGPQVSYIAHVSAEANGREVHRTMNLGTNYSSEQEAYDDIERSLQAKGITRYNINIEQKYDPQYHLGSNQQRGGTATGRTHGTPGIGDMISGRINREIRAGIPDRGGYATGGTDQGQRPRDGSQWWRDRLPRIKEDELAEDIESHLYLMSRAGYDIVQEAWSDKYKDSINCSNPKGFSQKAHCAGKKKNEEVSEEKVRLDPKCWSGKKIGNPKTKMKGGVRVNNCVPK